MATVWMSSFTVCALPVGIKFGDTDVVGLLSLCYGKPTKELLCAN